ncbi:MAG: ribulokinase [Cyclobacteriaceae bacterium]|nr:ribulokinase [Cyclobacteriaceae bacterium]
MKDTKYVIGLDYGTDSVRAIVVDTVDGKEMASSVFYYPRWKAGKYCQPAKNQFRQHPLDYLDGLENTIKNSLNQCGPEVAMNVVGICVDTTGSTPIAVNKAGTPLSLTAEYAENPNAMFVLWKDHTAVGEAEEINRLARSWGGIDFTKYEGGIYSSEWFWAKILHVLRADEKVREAAYSWVEHCDWIPALLTGETDPIKLKRSRCAAGHKAMWHPDFGGLPDEAFLAKLDPLLSGLRTRLFSETYTADTPVGTLTKEWADKLGLSTSVVIAAGTFDAHAGALGGEIEAYTLSKVMGTSTCDMLVAPMEEAGKKLVKGICGQVDGSIVPGMLGLEAGQSAFGDIYAWFKNVLMWPVEDLLKNSDLLDEKTKIELFDKLNDTVIARLSEEAAKIPIGETGIISMDWMHGRRTPDANQSLKGAITGLNLGSGAPAIFKSLVEATCFGSRKIVDRFLSEGIPIKNVVALGGVAKKSPYVMRVMADVLNMPIQVAKSEQTPALGAAMLAATAAGIYPNTEKAKKAMGAGFDAEYFPIPENVAKYKVLYAKYSKLGEFIEQHS